MRAKHRGQVEPLTRVMAEPTQSPRHCNNGETELSPKIQPPFVPAPCCSFASFWTVEVPSLVGLTRDARAQMQGRPTKAVSHRGCPKNSRSLTTFFPKPSAQEKTIPELLGCRTYRIMYSIMRQGYIPLWATIRQRHTRPPTDNRDAFTWP